MYLRVMIVDDEYLIRNLIRMKLDWDAYGMEIVAEAGNSKEALALAKLHQPDIIFTDICMPDMDGIEFTRRITKADPDIKIVIITGYDEFEYARQGLQLGVVDYLLKPLKSEELQAVAKKLVSRIGGEQHRKQEMARLRELLAANRPVLKERFLCGLVTGAGNFEEIHEQLKYFQLPLRFGSDIEVVVIEARYPAQSSEEHRLMLETRAGEAVREYYSAVSAVVFHDYRRRIVMIMPYSPETEDSYEQLLAYMRGIIHCPITIGVGGPVSRLDAACHSYAHACDALHYRVVAGDNKVVYYEDIINGKPSMTGIQDPSIEKLMFYIQAGAVSQAVKLLDGIMARTAAAGPGETALLQARTMAMDIVVACQHLFIDDGPNKQALAFMFADTFPEIRDGLADYLQAMVNKASSKRKEKNHTLASQATAYIYGHMAEEDLRISSVAANLFISPGHLGRLMKRETGKTFLEYLTDLRITKAIELLRSTDLKVYEIGGRVGIQDPHYFSILFKKCTGMSVNEFRSSIHSGSSAPER